MDPAAARVPALFLASPDDRVVDPATTAAIAAVWGADVVIEQPVLTAADDPYAHVLAGVVLISPNYRLRATAVQVMLDAPFVAVWGPLVAGAERSFVPVNADHAKWWTTRYPTAALFPMATLMRHVRAMDPAAARVPALFLTAPDDRVVDPATTAAIAAAWGADMVAEHVALTAADDPWGHVLAGRVLSPGQTAPMVALILAWVRGL